MKRNYGCQPKRTSKGLEIPWPSSLTHLNRELIETEITRNDAEHVERMTEGCDELDFERGNFLNELKRRKYLHVLAEQTTRESSRHEATQNMHGEQQLWRSSRKSAKRFTLSKYLP